MTITPFPEAQQVSEMYLTQSSDYINIQMNWEWKKKKIKAFRPPGNKKVRCPLAQPEVHTKEKTPIKEVESFCLPMSASLGLLQFWDNYTFWAQDKSEQDYTCEIIKRNYFTVTKHSERK